MPEGRNSLLAKAIQPDHKGFASVSLYSAATALAFVKPCLCEALDRTTLFVIVAILWMVPDRRIESAAQATIAKTTSR